MYYSQVNSFQLRVIYSEGDIICSLFDDIYPTLVAAFIARPRGDDEVFSDGVYPELKIDCVLPTNESRCIFTFNDDYGLAGSDAGDVDEETEDVYYLIYSEQKSSIIIHRDQCVNGFLLGIVISGENLIRDDEKRYEDYSVEQS